MLLRSTQTKLEYCLLLLLCALFASLSAATQALAEDAKAPADETVILIAQNNAGGAGYSSAAPISFTDRHQQYWNGNPHEGTEEKALQQQQEDGQDPPDKYKPNKMAEMHPSGQDAEKTDTPGQTTAKQANGKQNDPHPIATQNEFTVYPNPMQNNFGPPSGLPYHHWPTWEGAPKTVDGGLNPAFSRGSASARPERRSAIRSRLQSVDFDGCQTASRRATNDKFS